MDFVKHSGFLRISIIVARHLEGRLTEDKGGISRKNAEPK